MFTKLAAIAVGSLALPWLGFAQTSSSHEGWSFSDTLQTATDVVVADVTGGESVDTGSQVKVTATVHIVRVVKGNLPLDSTLSLAFTYSPSPGEGPEMTTKVSLIRALFFLEQQAGQGYRPLQASPGFFPMGAMMVPVSHALIVYEPDSTLNARLAREYELALKELVTTHQADFAQDRWIRYSGGTLPPFAVARSQFEGLVQGLTQLEPDSLAVYRSLSESPQTILRILGLTGRLHHGDVTALAEIEKDLPQFTRTMESHRFTLGMIGLKLADNPEAAHTLARIALADPTLPNFETALGNALAQMRSLEFMPYAILLLDSSDAFVRAISLVAACQILQNSQSELWTASMQQHCPDQSPPNDLSLHQSNIQFWKDWWVPQRERLAKLMTLPDPRPPVRWLVPPRQARVSQWKPVLLEITMGTLLRQVIERPSHAHDDAGAIINAPESPTIADSLLKNPDDREVFHAAAKEASAQAEALNARVTSLLNAARLKGAIPDRESLIAIESERRATLKKTINDLLNRFTPEGRKAIEDYSHATTSGGGGLGTAPLQ
ncbi:MAG: hypothetical protein ABI693_28480 [Bryobacteraceae bacterium]